MEQGSGSHTHGHARRLGNLGDTDGWDLDIGLIDQYGQIVRGGVFGDPQGDARGGT